MLASTPSRSTQAGARHRERAEPTSSSSPRPPAFSHRSPLLLSIFSRVFIECQHQLSPHLPCISLSRHCPSHPPSTVEPLTLFLCHRHLLTVSECHRGRPLPCFLFLSPAPPPSANCRPLPGVSPVEHHQSSTSALTSLFLCRRRLLLFPFLASVATPSPVFPSSRHHPNCLRLLLLRLRRAPPISLPPSPQPSTVIAHRHRHPPLHCVAERHRRSLVLHLSHLLRRPPRLSFHRQSPSSPSIPLPLPLPLFCPSVSNRCSDHHRRCGRAPAP